ncbi:5924_t:CDS:10, partial [Gigaspora rosea]
WVMDSEWMGLNEIWDMGSDLWPEFGIFKYDDWMGHHDGWQSTVMVRLLLLETVLILILSLTIQVHYAFGIYADQAGINDWYQQYIGTPKCSFFHRLPTRGTTILIASESNVVASIKPFNGNIEWRQVLEDDDTVIVVIAAISVSEHDGYIVRLWEIQTGFMLWEKKIKPAGFHRINSRNGGEKVDVVFTANSMNVIVLVGGHTIVNFNNIDGRQIWRSDLAESPTLLHKLVEHNQNIYAIGLKKSSKSYSIEVVTYDVQTGVLKSTSLSSKIGHIKDMIVVGGGSNTGFIVWKEGQYVRVNRLGSDTIEQSSLESLYRNVIPSFAGVIGDLEFVNLNISSRTEFLIQAPTANGNSAAVFKIDLESGRLTALYDLGHRNSTSIYSGALDKSEQLIISRIRLLSKDLVKVEIVAPAHRLALGSHEISYSMAASGGIKKSLLDVTTKKNNETTSVAYRMLIVSDDGSIHFFKEDSIAWNREESLTHATEVEFLDLPEKKLWTQEVDELDEQSEESETISPFARYVRRLMNHIEQLKDFPEYLITYVQRSATGNYSVDPSPMTKAKTSLYRDTFGFRKLLIFMTRTKLVALDTSNKGQIVWSRYFGGIISEFQKIFVVRSSTVKLNALTGEDFITDHDIVAHTEDNISFSIPTIAHRIFKLPVEEPDERTHIIALLDEDLKASSLKAFQKFSASFYFTLSDGIGGKSLNGYKVAIDKISQPFSISRLWKLNFPEGNTIVAIGHRPNHEKVASLGRVLGNRSVLYKYLNPHIVAVATLSPSTSLDFYLIDTIKGSILYHAVHDNVSPSHPVQIIQVENTIVYHFWSEDQGKQEKGYKVVVCDLYDSEKPDERFDNPNFTSFANERPHVNAQAFMFPYGVRTIGVTTTKNGIPIREFLFALDTYQVFGLSKRFLDPRRPQRALTNEDKEEMLIPYEPTIPDNKKFILSYNLPIYGIRHIATSPALLESTSLVFAYGLDLWFTREAPSKTFDVLSEDFSKGTLLATILGLVVGILITKPP